MANFIWGEGGRATTPEAAARQRAIAQALISRADTPAQNWAQGLSDIASAWSGSILNQRAAEDERAGQEAVAAALAGLTPESSFTDIAGVLSNPWASASQGAVAQVLLNQNIQANDPMYQLDLAYKQAQIDKMAAEVARGGGDETFFGTPIYTQDAEGNIFANQLGNRGTFNPIVLPEGQSLAPVTKEIDTGTEIITFDRNGNELFRTPKDLRGAAYETGYGSVEGKTEAENDALRQSISSKLPGLRSVVDTLTRLADTATYTQSGQIMDSVKRELGLPVGQGAIDRASYIAIVDNQVLPLLRDTFGAAFTQKEGESLRATLGNPNVSPAEKKAILEAFIEQKERDIVGMETNMPGGNPVQAPAPVTPATSGQGGMSQIPTFATQADFNAAPSGTVFRAPDGSIRVKP